MPFRYIVHRSSEGAVGTVLLFGHYNSTTIEMLPWTTSSRRQTVSLRTVRCLFPKAWDIQYMHPSGSF